MQKSQREVTIKQSLIKFIKTKNPQLKDPKYHIDSIYDIWKQAHDQNHQDQQSQQQLYEIWSKIYKQIYYKLTQFAMMKKRHMQATQTLAQVAQKKTELLGILPQKELEQFFCPISFQLMKNPVVCKQCGNSFDQDSIRLIILQNNICPLCLKITSYVVNLTLKKFIEKQIIMINEKKRLQKIETKWNSQLAKTNQWLEKQLSEISYSGPIDWSSWKIII